MWMVKWSAGGKYVNYIGSFPEMWPFIARERGRGSTTCTEPGATESSKLDKELFSRPQIVEVVKEAGCYAYKLEGGE